MHGKKHPTKHSQSQSWSEWSDWKWDPSASRYYVERFDPHGNVDYMWDGGAPIVDDHQRTPRTESTTIDQVTTGLGGLSFGSSDYNHGPAVVSSGRDGSLINGLAPDVTGSPQYTLHTPYNDTKGKGVADSTAHDAHFGDEFTPSTASHYGQQDYGQHTDLAPGPGGYRGVAATSSMRSNSGDIPDDYYSTSRKLDSTDEQLEHVLKTSRDDLLGNSLPSRSAASGVPYDTVSISPGTYSLNPTSSRSDEITPNITPISARTGLVNTSGTNFIGASSINGAPGSVEQIDNRFVVEHSYKFQPGEVFKILWSEPKGQVAGDATISDVRPVNDSSGPFYVGYRRFIIVSTDESHHSTCVPILTYDRRGCGKNGVRPNKHGIIHATGQRPKLLKNEPELGFDPVPLEIYAEGESLASESRVNYSKLVTIEHNVKVFFIGRIPQPYFDNVSFAVDKCWSDKMRSRGNKKSRR